jgi:hypothetical protein
MQQNHWKQKEKIADIIGLACIDAVPKKKIDHHANDFANFLLKFN